MSSGTKSLSVDVASISAAVSSGTAGGWFSMASSLFPHALSSSSEETAESRAIRVMGHPFVMRT